jgi:hypothetical protein
VTPDALTTLLSCSSARPPCNFKALFVAMASFLVAFKAFVLRALWRLSMRTASITTITISDDGFIACRRL